MYLIECLVSFMGHKVLATKLRGNHLSIEWDSNVERSGEKICVNFAAWVAREHLSHMFLSRDGECDNRGSVRSD